MKTVKIIRTEQGLAGTFGAVVLEGEAFCVSLELPDKDNRVNVSCVPVGRYVCNRYHSRRYGDTFQIMGVEGRSYILFHAGNTVDDSRGCVLLGQYWGKLRGDRAVLNSGRTFREFMRRLDGVYAFDLEIVET